MSDELDYRPLGDKFTVTRNDGRDAPGEKHHGCRYFVIDVDHDENAAAALKAYADHAIATRPRLALDLQKVVFELEDRT